MVLQNNIIIMQKMHWNYAMVMDTLSEIDQVAYVRFASVYRNFREARDFEKFVGDLKEDFSKD